ncbi:MAG: hypothetical protein BGO69_04815 [Bacteroidetes bacterium 46-16]|nr:MAG: hypothetical protein BGO69_04815 [Bacteroidetes bacterium 46-16]
MHANRFVRFLSKKDKQDCFVYIPNTSNLARLLIERNNIKRKDFKYIMLLTNNTIYLHFDAVIESLLRLGSIWIVIGVLKILPKMIRSNLY